MDASFHHVTKIETDEVSSAAISGFFFRSIYITDRHGERHEITVWADRSRTLQIADERTNEELQRLRAIIADIHCAIRPENRQRSFERVQELCEEAMEVDPEAFV